MAGSLCREAAAGGGGGGDDLTCKSCRRKSFGPSYDAEQMKSNGSRV
jgi:hypothetical protein